MASSRSHPSLATAVKHAPATRPPPPAAGDRRFQRACHQAKIHASLANSFPPALVVYSVTIVAFLPAWLSTRGAAKPTQHIHAIIYCTALLLAMALAGLTLTLAARAHKRFEVLLRSAAPAPRLRYWHRFTIFCHFAPPDRPAILAALAANNRDLILLFAAPSTCPDLMLAKTISRRTQGLIRPGQLPYPELIDHLEALPSTRTEATSLLDVTDKLLFYLSARIVDRPGRSGPFDPVEPLEEPQRSEMLANVREVCTTLADMASQLQGEHEWHQANEFAERLATQSTTTSDFTQTCDTIVSLVARLR